MKWVVLYRGCVDNYSEYSICKKYFEMFTDREDIYSTCDKEPVTVIGRYSVLPYYSELFKGLFRYGHKLINCLSNHQYIANGNYMFHLENTPESWLYDTFIHLDKDGPFVVKGATNSKKFYWDTHMYAKNKAEAIKVAARLREDSLLETQDIIVRKYIPLMEFEIGLHGLPFSNEYRLFYYNGKFIAGGYYWSIAKYIPKTVPPEALELGCKTALQINKNYPGMFVCIDVAQTRDNKWIVIELNDGQMSGLSTIDPEVFYKNLRDVVDA